MSTTVAVDLTSVTDLVPSSTAELVDFSSYGTTAVAIAEITCDEWAKDKTFDYYELMIVYKSGFIATTNTFLTWDWFYLIVPFVYS